MTQNASASATSELKHEAIRQAGMAVFLERGYEAASMDMIAIAAGVSKQTIYNHFLSKEALFRDIVEDMVSTLLQPIRVRTSPASTPEELLRAFGCDMLEMMLRPSSLALHRLIVAESARFPEFGRAIYEAGPGRLLAMLADYLRRETCDGRLAVRCPELAADQFIGMLTGRIQLRALLGVDESSSPRAVQDRVHETVRSFLAVHAPSPAGRKSAG